MNNEESIDRRAHIVTRLIFCLTIAGAAAYLIEGRFSAPAIVFALAYLILLCHVVNLNPFKLIWYRLRKMVGHKFDTRFAWGEVNLHRPYWDLAFRFSERHSDYGGDALIIDSFIGGVYLFLPTKFCARFRPKGVDRCDRDSSFGFYTIDHSIVWRWATGYYSWDIPYFSMNHFSTEVLSLDRKTIAFIEYARESRETRADRYAESQSAKEANSETHPYIYVRRNGEVQHRTAKIYVDRMTWQRKWFPFLHHVKTTIWVTFNEEIGEEVGSWKGGTTGCGYELRDNETPLQCLRRMEKEREFCRGRSRREKSSTKWGWLTRLFTP